MGSGRFDASDWVAYSTVNNYSSKSTEEIFSSRNLHEDLNIKGKIRESRDSADNPNSTPIILALDVTGSMGDVADHIAKKGLPVLCTQIYERKPISDPHICVCGVGDHSARDEAPFQASQFEADIRIAKELEKIYLEYGGGGNSYEGYIQTWYFASRKVSADAFGKKRKGFIFTMGDEQIQPKLTKANILDVFGDSVQEDITAQQLLDEVAENYEVFHLVIEQGHHCRYGGKEEVYETWRKVLGQHVIPVADYTKIPEIIVSLLEVNSGKDKEEIVASWNGDTSIIVQNALSSLETVYHLKEEDGLVVL